jgi:hypothetical protein
MDSASLVLKCLLLDPRVGEIPTCFAENSTTTSTFVAGQIQMFLLKHWSPLKTKAMLVTSKILLHKSLSFLCVCVKSLIFPSDSSGFGKCPLFLLQVFVGDYPEIISAIYIYSIYSLVMLTVKHYQRSFPRFPLARKHLGALKREPLALPLSMKRARHGLAWIGFHHEKCWLNGGWMR